MKTIRIIAKANLLLSIVLLFAWLAYRVANGPIGGEPLSLQTMHGTGLVDLLFWQGLLAYLFFVDRRIAEDFFRGVGVIGALGLVILLVKAALQNQIYGFQTHPQEPMLVYYQRFAVVLCALIGRRALTQFEAVRLKSVASRLARRDATSR